MTRSCYERIRFRLGRHDGGGDGMGLNGGHGAQWWAPHPLGHVPAEGRTGLETLQVEMCLPCDSEDLTNAGTGDHRVCMLACHPLSAELYRIGPASFYLWPFGSAPARDGP